MYLLGGDDNLRVHTVWLLVIDDNLPPRELWPEYLYPPGLAYPDTLNLAATLLEHANRAPHAHAIRYRGRVVSYDALRRRVLELAASLDRAGVRPTDRVGLRLPNSPDFTAAWLAIQWLGAIGVPIPTPYRRRETEVILERSGASLICDDGFIREHDATRGPSDALRFPEPVPTRRDHPAVITYITDSNGTLKGAVHSAAEILASADTYARDVLALTSSDVCIGTTSLAWAFGLGALLTSPLRVGATIVLPEGPLELLQAIESERATVLFSVPTMYRMLLQRADLDRAPLRSLRCCVSASEPLPPDLVEQWRSRTGLDIVDGFGTTELTHIFISARLNDVRPGFIGRVVPGYEARIVDADMQTVPDGTPGLLAVRGPTGARYWRDAEAQRHVVKEGWTLTGDVCVRHADGWYRHLGRSDSLVISAGYKIAVREVERVLEEHPDVASARVFPVADPIRGSVTKAVVMRGAGVDAAGLAERLQQYLKGELAAFKCPRQIQIE